MSSTFAYMHPRSYLFLQDTPLRSVSETIVLEEMKVEESYKGPQMNREISSASHVQSVIDV